MLSISVGGVVCKSSDEKLGRLFARADDRLYEDKKKWH